MLSKPFISMQVFSFFFLLLFFFFVFFFFKIGREIRKLQWFKCITAQIKYAKPNYKGFSRFGLLQIIIDV